MGLVVRRYVLELLIELLKQELIDSFGEEGMQLPLTVIHGDVHMHVTKYKPF